MATEQDLSSEIAAAVAGVSHMAHYTDADGAATLKQQNAIYQYLPEQSVMVMINHDENNVEIWFDPIKTDKEWFEETFKPTVEEIAHRNLYGIVIRSYAGGITPKKLIHRTDVAESRNTTKTSYKPLGGTKLILRHNKPVTEEKPGARSRNIGAIFVEKDGERFRYPYNHLLGARVMALHVESGGKPWDDNGSKILEISRRRKDIMELLRWSKRLDNTQQIDEIRERGQAEVVALKRTMERAARTGDLSGIVEFQLPSKEVIDSQSMVSEAVAELDNALNKLLG